MGVLLWMCGTDMEWGKAPSKRVGSKVKGKLIPYTLGKPEHVCNQRSGSAYIREIVKLFYS